MRWLASFSLLTAPRLPLPRTTCLHGITSAARWNSNRPKAKQSLGQNFLSDTTIARRIVQGLDDTVGTLRPGDDDGFRVIELGPGQGALTGQLLATYPAMTAVEIDQRMIEVHTHHHHHRRRHYPCSTPTTTPHHRHRRLLRRLLLRLRHHRRLLLHHHHLTLP